MITTIYSATNSYKKRFKEFQSQCEHLCELSIKKTLLNVSQNLEENTCNFTKKETQVFPCELCEFFSNTVSTERLQKSTYETVIFRDFLSVERHHFDDQTNYVCVANTWRKREQLFRNRHSHANLAVQTSKLFQNLPVLEEVLEE